MNSKVIGRALVVGLLIGGLACGESPTEESAGPTSYAGTLDLHVSRVDPAVGLFRLRLAGAEIDSIKVASGNAGWRRVAANEVRLVVRDIPSDGVVARIWVHDVRNVVVVSVQEVAAAVTYEILPSTSVSASLRTLSGSSPSIVE